MDSIGSASLYFEGRLDVLGHSVEVAVLAEDDRVERAKTPARLCGDGDYPFEQPMIGCGKPEWVTESAE